MFHAAQSALHERQVERAAQALRAAGVEPVLAKGWALARLYPAPGMRPYGDVDLYVRPEEYHRASDSLRQSLSDVPIDLHRGVPHLDDRGPDQIESRLQTVPVAATSVRVLGEEDHLRYVCLHLLGHGAWRPVWLCDVALLLESLSPRFDWDYFLAGDPRRTEWVAGVVSLTGQLLGAEVASRAPALAGRVAPRWLSEAVLREWGRLAHQPHGTRLPMKEALRHPAALAQALRIRWPNPVEATFECRGPFNDAARLPYQVWAGVRRGLRFGRLAMAGSPP